MVPALRGAAAWGQAVLRLRARGRASTDARVSAREQSKANMRQTIQNVGLLVIVLSLSAVFLLEFGGPQSRGCAGDVGARYAAKVYGETISLGEMKAAYVLANGPRYSTETAREMKLKELVLEGLIERDLLAREAREVGFATSREDVMVRLAEEGLLYVSAPVGAPSSIPSGALPVSFEDKDGNFDPENVRRFIQNRLGRTVEEFANSQMQETLAERMRETVGASVAIAPEEVWDAYVREKDKAVIRYVRFDLAHFRDQSAPSTSELDAWVSGHQAQVDAEYEKEKHRYTGLEKQVRARHILIKVASEGDEATKEAAKKAAKAKAEAARARALKGEDFAQLSKDLSEDTGSARKGGDLGYNPRGRMVAPFDDAQFALKPGDISEVVESRFGYHVIKVEGVREGDVPLAEAKREIAETLLKDARAEQGAKAAAEKVLAELKGGLTLDALEARLKAEKEAGGEAAAQAPVVKDSRPFGRGDSPIAGVDNKDLVKTAFELTTENSLPSAPVKAGDSWVVFKLASRDTADKAAFAGAEQERLSDALLRRKRLEALESHVRALRKRAEDEGAVRINPEAVRYSASEETASL
jgi:peptidyl-prolyl cis-trans isomerase D